MNQIGRGISSFGIWLLAAAFFAIPLTALRPLTSVTFGDLFLVLATGVAVLLVLLRRRLPRVPVWLAGGGALLVVGIGITVVWPPAAGPALVDAFGEAPYGSSVEAGLRLLIAIILLPVVVAVIADGWSKVSLLVNAWIAGAAFSCLIAVVDGFTGTGLQEAMADNAAEVAGFLSLEPARYVGLGVHPTSFSVTAAMAAPMVLSKMDSRRMVAIYSPVMLLLLLGVVLSGSRVGLAGFGFAVLLTLLLNAELRRTLIPPDLTVAASVAAVAVIAGLVFVVGPPATPAGSNLPDKVGTGGESAGVNRLNPLGISAQASNVERIERYEDSINFIVERPLLGYGFEWVEASHDIYLQLLVSGGIIALLGFLWAIGGYLRQSFLDRPRMPAGMVGISCGLTVSVITFLAMGLVQTDLLDRYLYLPAALILAMSAIVTASAEEPPGD